MSAHEAEKAGLVSKVFPVEELVEEAVKLGERIAGMSKVAIAMAKECVNAADNLSLDEGWSPAQVVNLTLQLLLEILRDSLIM